MYWYMMDLFFRYEYCYVYEIYPQSETPHLTKIAHLDVGPSRGEDAPVHLLPGTVIWFNFHNDSVVCRVWDYHLNHSINFSVDVDVNKLEFQIEVDFNLSKALKLASNSLVDR